MGDNYELAKKSYENFLLQNHLAILTKLNGTKHPWMKGTQNFAYKDLSIIKKEMIRVFFSHNQCYDILIALSKCAY
mgnify:CR=1 FL=1